MIANHRLNHLTRINCAALALGAWFAMLQLNALADDQQYSPTSASICITTGFGRLNVESYDPQIEVRIEQGGQLVKIIDKTTGKEVLLDTGQYSLQLSGEADGLALKTDKFTLERNGVVVVRAWVEKSKPLQGFHDAFDGSYDTAWSVLNHNPSHVSLTKQSGMLTITTERGGLWHGFNNAKNVFLSENPIADGGDFVMTTHLVGFDPKTNYNQAGLVCFDDMDNYLALTLQWDRNQGGRGLCLVREVGGKDLDQPYLKVDSPLNDIWLRIIKSGNQYLATSSQDGKKYQIIGAGPWGDGSPMKIGLIAKNGGPGGGAPELDASFDFFDIRPLGNDPVGLFSDADTQSQRPVAIRLQEPKAQIDL